jgi:NAD(P)-dependent dehydrogenase (short-subunit alcohol dehydrogenase family)
MRLEGKTAIIVGAGQTPGTTIGNGRAMAILFAREGADVLCVDRDGARAAETVEMITKEGRRAESLEFDRIFNVNLKGALLMTKAAIPVMREAGKGAIVNISSLASIAGGNQVAYEISKAAVNRLTTSIAQANARHGIRCNAVLPGLMDTPMAVAGIARASGKDEETVRQERNSHVPLGGKMGTAWDTAHAALFLASDEAKFITGVLLPVDGGMSVRIG